MKGRFKSALALKFLFTTLILYTCAVPITSQTTIQFASYKSSNHTLDKYFVKSSVFEVDLNSLNQVISFEKNQDELVEFKLPGIGDFQFTLNKVDIRSDAYKLMAQTERGLVEMPRSETITYRGYTKKDNRDVRLTITNNFISGFITTAEGELFIELVNNFDDRVKSNNRVVVYYTQDVRQSTLGQCASGRKLHADKSKIEKQINQSPQRSLACKQVEIAIANDFEMFQDHGNSVAGVEAHVLSILNLVETNYDDEFSDNLEFSLTEVFVSTCNSCDPWSGTNNIETILDEFRDWGPTGFSAQHDVATLWSPRPFFYIDDNGNQQNGVIGLAFVGVICNSFRYNVCEDYTNSSNFLRVLQAHEMGHNFDANHDASGSGFIMAPSVTNTSEWSPASISNINDEISNSGCLTPCVAGSPPSADLSVTNQSGCANLEVQFFDESTNNPAGWQWTFEGGTPSSSNQQNPIVTYDVGGTFNVSLEVTNAFGTDNISFSNFIDVFENPIAEFGFSISNLNVNFNNFSENYESVEWDFGDGFSSTLDNPNHTYDEDGNYNVILTVTNPCGSVSYEDVIIIATAPSAGFTFDQAQGCAEFSVQFSDQSSSNATTFNWTFEGGNPSFSNNPNPIVSYTLPGTYDVTLLVTNDVGVDELLQSNIITVLESPLAEIDFSVNGLTVDFTALTGSNETFLWSFGDGFTSSESTVAHTYATGGNYLVQLTTSNDCGDDISTITVSLNSSPSASFTSNINAGCAPVQVQFENTSAGTVESVLWSFPGGNPATSTSFNPIVTYAAPGNYSVEMTAMNSIGSDIVILSNYITVVPNIEADFSYDVTGTTVEFGNISIGADDFQWFFGDGQSSILSSPNHNYTNDGVYEVMLIVNGTCGVDTNIQTIVIATQPIASFEASETNGCGPLQVQFQNLSTQNVNSYSWTFEGGQPSTSNIENPLVLYDIPGTYEVRLVVTSAGGSDELILQDYITVLPIPEADFSFTNVDGFTFTFQNESLFGMTYLWDFGDGSNSTDEHPTHTYVTLDDYLVKLTVFGACGQHEHTLQLSLATAPIASFSTTQQSGCVPFEVQFDDQSMNNPTSWEWTFTGGSPPTSTMQNPVVTYAAPGTYAVSLKAINSAGSSLQISGNFITVLDQPTSDFVYMQDGQEVIFENASTSSNSWTWDFGNGRTSNEKDASEIYDQPGEYTVTLYAMNACGIDTSTQVVTIITTGIGDEALDTWQIYPNPTSDFVMIDGPLASGGLEISLVNVLGQKVFRETSDIVGPRLHKQLDVTSFSEGLYYLIILTKDGRHVFELILSR